MLLSRNQLPEHRAQIPEIKVTDTRIERQDPLSDTFQVPEDIGTPWKLVTYYKAVLARKESGGVKWSPPLGDNHKIYLRPAKKLLVNGEELAARAIVYGISIATFPPGLQWILDKIPEMIERMT